MASFFERLSEARMSSDAYSHDLSSLADWFDAIEFALRNIARKGGVDVWQPDVESDDVETNIALCGGIDGWLRILKREAFAGTTSRTFPWLLAHVYEMPTLISLIGKRRDDAEHFLALVPRCKRCYRLCPGYADHAAFRECVACLDEGDARPS